MSALRKFYLFAMLAAWSTLVFVAGALSQHRQGDLPALTYQSPSANAATLLQCPVTTRALREWDRDCRERARESRIHSAKE